MKIHSLSNMDKPEYIHENICDEVFKVQLSELREYFEEGFDINDKAEMESLLNDDICQYSKEFKTEFEYIDWVFKYEGIESECAVYKIIETTEPIEPNDCYQDLRPIEFKMR